ncbi:hypothetical protein HYS97_01860 [Candidatus Daviesbacteria bacterium]|nr:hypothetical protein [Candidatus Daviesbacteria bacterium]
MKTVIGLVGEKGSGKETFGNFLMDIAKGKKVMRIRFSGILNETLKLWSLDGTRHNLQHLAVVMEEGFSKGTLTNAIRKRVESLNADIVILDGVRWKTDEELIRSFGKNFLIYVTAETRLRFERLQKRQEKKDEARTFEQFMKEEKAKNELLIPQIGKRADFKVENNGTFEELKVSVQKLYPILQS